MAAFGPNSHHQNGNTEDNIIHLCQMISDNNLTGVLRLLDEGVNPNDKAPGLHSPLFLATVSNYLPMVTALLAKGAIPAKVANGDLVDEYGALTTPYIEAEKRGFHEIIKAFNNAMHTFWNQYDTTSHIVAMARNAFNPDGILVEHSRAITRFASSKSKMLAPDGDRKYPIVKSTDGILFAIFKDKQLGSGAAGTVYLAQNLATKELCAVKESQFKSQSIPQNEIDALRIFKRLKGHQTVDLKEGTACRYRQYIFMTLHQGVSGLSVRQAILDHDLLLSPIEQLKMMQGMLKECQQFNTLRFSHGDLDTRNIVFEPISWKPTIIDFGKYSLPGDYHRSYVGFSQTRFALYKCAYVILSSLAAFRKNSSLAHQYEMLIPSSYHLIREISYIAGNWYALSAKHIIEYTDSKIEEIDELINKMRNDTALPECSLSSSGNLSDSDEDFTYSPPRPYVPNKKRIECGSSSLEEGEHGRSKLPRFC